MPQHLWYGNERLQGNNFHQWKAVCVCLKGWFYFNCVLTLCVCGCVNVHAVPQMSDPWITGGFKDQIFTLGITISYPPSLHLPCRCCKACLRNFETRKLGQTHTRGIPIDVKDCKGLQVTVVFSSQKDALFPLSVTALKEGNCLPSSLKTDSRDHGAFYLKHLR